MSFIGRGHEMSWLLPLFVNLRHDLIMIQPGSILHHISHRKLLFYSLVCNDGGVEHFLAKLVQHLLPVVFKYAFDLVDCLRKSKLFKMRQNLDKLLEIACYLFFYHPQLALCLTN